jgi:hypothetical protein
LVVALQTVLGRENTESLALTPPAAFGGTGEDTGSTKPFSFSELGPVCATQRLIGVNPVPAVVRLMASLLSPLTGRSINMLETVLLDPSTCEALNAYRSMPVEEQVIVGAVRPLELAPDGYPVSTNVVWNKCVRGTATLADVRSNPDVIRFRSGKIIHKDCGSYRMTGSNQWTYPNDPMLLITINPPAAGSHEPVVSVPNGYAVVPAELEVAAQ